MSVKIKANDMDRKEITASLGYEYEGFGGRKTFIEEEMRWDGSSLDDIVAEVERIRAEYSDRFTDIKLDKDSVYDYDGERTVWRFVGKRMETDAEYNARIEMIKQREADRIEHDRAEYARLKAQFGE
jgi:hypothetical protein